MMHNASKRLMTGLSNRRYRIGAGAALLLFIHPIGYAADAPAANRQAMGAVPCSWSVPIQRPDHTLDVPATIRLLRANGFTCYVQPIEERPPMSFDDFNRLLP